MVVKSCSVKTQTKPKFLRTIEKRRELRRLVSSENAIISRLVSVRKEEQDKIGELKGTLREIQAFVDEELGELHRINRHHPALLPFGERDTLQVQSIQDVFRYVLVYRGIDDFHMSETGAFTLRFSLIELQSHQEYAVAYALTDRVIEERDTFKYVLRLA